MFESSETDRIVTEYGTLPVRELGKRIVSYEKKYGSTYARYSRQFDCDNALPWETSDLMDWQNLVEEKNERARRSVKRSRSPRAMAGINRRR